MNFSDFHLLKVDLISIAINDKQRTYMIYVMDQVAEKEKIFINLLRLIELKFISTTWLQ